ncbi:Transcription initiation factor IIA subunit 1, partial [Taenia solium]
AGFYNGVINDVIEGMKETFTQEGLDLDLLEQLRKLWSSKLAETHVADPEPVAQPAVHYAQRLQATQFQQTCVGQQGIPIPISRLPIQPNSLTGVSGGGGAIRTLAPIARPNAPLTISAATPATGLVLRSAVGATVQAPGTTAGRPPIVLAAALNPQAAGVQPRLANPLAGIAIRAPMQASGPGQPGTATTATIIGQPTMASVNGVTTIPGQNVQILQVGQQTFMVPVQFRQSLGSATTTPQQLQDTTGTTTATTVLAAAAPQQTQQQSFNRTQVDGVDDSDFDNNDDVEVVEPYSVDMPSSRVPTSIATPHSLFSRTPGSTAQSVMGGSSTGIRGGGEAAITTTPGGSGDGEDESDDDDTDMVVATPGVIGSMPTPNPASVVAATSTIPATPHTMPTSTATSATVTTANTTTTKRSHETVTPGGGSGLSHNRVAKRPRISALVGKEFREYDDDLDDDLADDEEEDEEVDVDDEEEEEFGPVTTMTPSGQRLEMPAAAATAEEAAMGGRSSSRRKQKMPAAVVSGGWQNTKTGGGGEDDHIPDLPPPLPSPPLPSANGGDEMSGGGIGTEDVEGTDGKGTGLATEDEEEEEPLNSGDDVTDEELESLFESDNLVVCQYEKVSHSRTKWRFWMRDGIMKIRGREHLFQKLFAEVDW